MLEDYGEHSLVKTRVYEGVPELVRALRADGVPLAIHSNKADAPTQAIAAALLDPADFVQSRERGRMRRSSPTRRSRWRSPHASGCPRHGSAYCGDSLVDMRTATAAGMVAVGAVWGFRTPEELVESGAAVVIDAPLELLALRG